MTGLVLGLCLAGEVENHVSAGLEAIGTGDFDQARQELDAAETALVSSEQVVLGSTMASIHFYRGVVEYYDGDRNEAVLDLWRLALVADPAYRFDDSLVTDREPRVLFEALRNEVAQRPQVPSGVREGDPRVYIDGRLMYDYDHLLHGLHLVQVLCDDGVLHSSQIEIPPVPIYASMCPGYAPPVTVVVPLEPPPDLVRPFPVGRTMMGGGGLLLAAGVALNFAVVAPAWREIEQARAFPQINDRASADALSQRFNRSRWATLGLFGAGAATLGAGVAWTVRF